MKPHRPVANHPQGSLPSRPLPVDARPDPGAAFRDLIEGADRVVTPNGSRIRPLRWTTAFEFEHDKCDVSALLREVADFIDESDATTDLVLTPLLIEYDNHGGRERLTLFLDGYQ